MILILILVLILVLLFVLVLLLVLVLVLIRCPPTGSPHIIVLVLVPALPCSLS